MRRERNLQVTAFQTGRVLVQDGIGLSVNDKLQAE
jgi:hypothetical protein